MVGFSFCNAKQYELYNLLFDNVKTASREEVGFCGSRNSRIHRVNPQLRVLMGSILFPSILEFAYYGLVLVSRGASHNAGWETG